MCPRLVRLPGGAGAVSSGDWLASRTFHDGSVIDEGCALDRHGTCGVRGRTGTVVTDGEILVRTAYASICGSDLHLVI
jgi:hypothetical protein